MMDWLNQQLHAGAQANEELSYATIFLRIIAAMVLGCLVACIHYYTRHKDSPPTNGFQPTIVLLTILLSMVVLAVGNNIARSFTLAGVLAIVRFRTVVKDTRDSAFVICAVIVGMAAGIGYLQVALIGLPIVAVAAYFTQYAQAPKPARLSNLHLRFLITNNPQAKVEEIMKRYVDAFTLKETSTSKKGTALDVSYRIRLRKGMQTPDLVKELHAIEGMQSVEWKS
jgi:uncharacterized membrane protein YhiD involved in acid resistance